MIKGEAVVHMDGQEPRFYHTIWISSGGQVSGPDGGLAAYVKRMRYLIIGHTEGAEVDDFGPKSLI